MKKATINLRVNVKTEDTMPMPVYLIEGGLWAICRPTRFAMHSQQIEIWGDYWCLVHLPSCFQIDGAILKTRRGIEAMARELEDVYQDGQPANWQFTCREQMREFFTQDTRNEVQNIINRYNAG